MASEDLDPDEVATVLRSSLSQLYRRLRQSYAGEGQLSLAESSALARIERAGAMTGAELARQEGISPQSVAATLAGLEQRGLLQREPDPSDGRRIRLSLTAAGHAEVHNKRAARTARMARSLHTDFSQDELAVLYDAAPLLERLAQMD